MTGAPILKHVASLRSDELDRRIAEALGSRPRVEAAEMARRLVTALVEPGNDEFVAALQETFSRDARFVESVVMWLACAAGRGFTRAAVVRHGEDALGDSADKWRELTLAEIRPDFTEWVARETT